MCVNLWNSNTVGNNQISNIILLRIRRFQNSPDSEDYKLVFKRISFVENVKCFESIEKLRRLEKFILSSKIIVSILKSLLYFCKRSTGLCFH